MLIAALLHDAVEDHGGTPRLREIEGRFGPEVSRMVAALSDTFAEDHDKKEGWDERKNNYLTRLREEPDDVLLISAADKLYNARTVLDEYRTIGAKVWDRFKRGREQQLWDFNALLSTFKSTGENRIVEELDRVIAELTGLSKHEASPGSPPPGKT
jgi:GTP pyrophosphokinase